MSNDYLELCPSILSYSEHGGKLSSELKSKDRSRILWFEVLKPHVKFFNVSVLDPFVLPALVCAMFENKNLKLTGSINSSLAYSISSPLQIILNKLFPELNIVNVILDDVVTSEVSTISKGVGTGFSCGVDSFTALKENYYDQEIPDFRVNTLAQINHSQSKELDTTVWESKSDFYSDAARVVGLPLIFIRSNLYTHSPLAYQKVHTLLNCSAIMSLPGLFSKYYYASSYQFNDLYVKETNDIAHAEPLVLQLISTDYVKFYASSMHLSRTEKTKQILDLDVTTQFLDVCTKNPTNKINCSLCYKCERTMMTLDAYGRLNDFYHLFNLARWKRRRASYIQKVKDSHNDIFLTELKDLGISTGYFSKMKRYKEKTVKDE